MDNQAEHLNVIVVDDEEGVGFLTEEQLKTDGHVVKRFKDPDKALEEISQNPDWAQVIVTDFNYQRPDINGLSFIRKAREFSPKAAVILMSAQVNDDAQIKREAPNLDLVGMLEKPVRFATLKENIALARNWIANHQ